MTKREKLLSHVAASLLGILTIIITAPDGKFGPESSKSTIIPYRSVRTNLNANLSTDNTISRYYSPYSARLIKTFKKNAIYPDTMDYRIAKRLKKRLKSNNMSSPNVHALARSVRQRQEIMQKDLKVSFISDDGKIDQEWDVNLHAYPTWINPAISYSSAGFEIDKKRINDYLDTNPIPYFSTPVDITLSQIALSGSVLRGKTDGIAYAGYEFSNKEAAKKIAQALKRNEESILFPLVWREGHVYLKVGLEEKQLSSIGVGKSNFRGSTWSRTQNVKKALNQHVHNVIVQPGETFSFNQTLNGPVTLGNGWKMAKVIFEGDQLRPSPGGGICQASTTTYRAIVDAGLPVLDRRSHSLYVSYYKKYGVGIDATIYPGVQDLEFTNDTNGPILIQSYDTEDKDAFVKFYGVPDGREVALEGPYFRATAPKGFLVNERIMSSKEIAWIQRIKYPDGEEKENIILSRYKTIPTGLAYEYRIVKRDDEEIAQATHAAAAN